MLTEMVELPDLQDGCKCKGKLRGNGREKENCAHWTPR